MGTHDVSDEPEPEQTAFTKALLEDVLALEQLIERGQIESGVRRIGAEQEMFLVDESMNPAPIATQILDGVVDDRLTTELALFNLEANLTPIEFGRDCLRTLELELHEVVGKVRQAAAPLGADVLLTGILPTLQQRDLGLDNMTPIARYRELNRTVRQLRGGDFRVALSGLDALDIVHDNVLLEACNTSFQLHFQVGADEFAQLYNLAQVVTAPVLACAVNSPVLFRHRLWSETRIALFERSVDDRDGQRLQRNVPPRVYFGDSWLHDSILELVREDIARFRVLLGCELDEKPLELVAQGIAPKLRALGLHTGTIYRWNRGCYGVTNGKPHLRIENRVLPAGPTIADEVANAAFFFGLMGALGDRYTAIEDAMRFDDAKANFLAAARHGLRAQFKWIGGETVTASELIIHELLPAAREGLRSRGIDEGDIDHYLGIVEARVVTERTGAQWMLDSLAEAPEDIAADARYRGITAEMTRRCRADEPVHTWPLANLGHSSPPLRASLRTVGQLMSSDVFTVRPSDIVDLAAAVMDWEHIRHILVENDKGEFVGLLSHRQLLRSLLHGDRDSSLRVADIMTREPLTVEPDTLTTTAIDLMREHDIDCLPVVVERRLVGIITEHDLARVGMVLLEGYLRSAAAEDGTAQPTANPSAELGH